MGSTSRPQGQKDMLDVLHLIVCIYFVAPRLKPRALHMLDKASITDLPLSPWRPFKESTGVSTWTFLKKKKKDSRKAIIQPQGKL